MQTGCRVKIVQFHVEKKEKNISYARVGNEGAILTNFGSPHSHSEGENPAHVYVLW